MRCFKIFHDLCVNQMEPALATIATNRKHKREVCRYWLQSKCLKGQACEFLHSIDYDKMPSCPMGDACDRTANCPYKHVDEKALCSNYQLGFCSLGRRCPHKHVEHAGPPPETSAYWLPEYAALTRQVSSKSFRRKACDYYVANKWCPYFDMCNFSH